MKRVIVRMVLALLIMAGITSLAAHGEDQTPVKILVIGDSMMRVTAHALELEAAKRTGVVVRSFTSLGSGLARLDVFDWIAKVKELTNDFKPDATIAWFGTNDRQAMKNGDEVIQPTAEGWNAEYSRRVGEMMDLLAPTEGTHVIWLELPHMRDAKIQSDVDAINKLVLGEAEKRERVEFFRTRPILNRKPDVFSPYVVGSKGMPLEVRDSDGVHLNRAGADLMAAKLMKQLLESKTTKASP